MYFQYIGMQFALICSGDAPILKGASSLQMFLHACCVVANQISFAHVEHHCQPFWSTPVHTMFFVHWCFHDLSAAISILFEVLLANWTRALVFVLFFPNGAPVCGFQTVCPVARSLYSLIKKRKSFIRTGIALKNEKRLVITTYL